MMRNQLSSLVASGRIMTTLEKAKELRPVAEKMITKGKRGTVDARRQVRRWIADRSLVKKLFDDVAPRFQERPGGYLRIVKLGPRKGDGAEMAILEMVDFQLEGAEEKEPAKETKKGRGRGSKKAAPAAEPEETAAEEPAAEAPPRRSAPRARRRKRRPEDRAAVNAAGRHEREPGGTTGLSSFGSRRKCDEPDPLTTPSNVAAGRSHLPTRGDREGGVPRGLRPPGGDPRLVTLSADGRLPAIARRGRGAGLRPRRVLGRGAPTATSRWRPRCALAAKGGLRHETSSGVAPPMRRPGGTGAVAAKRELPSERLVTPLRRASSACTRR